MLAKRVTVCELGRVWKDALRNSEERDVEASQKRFINKIKESEKAAERRFICAGLS